MELKPGYKQTEVGVIPEDWDVSTLNGKVTITHGFAFSSRHFSTHGPFRLTTPGHFFEQGGFREIGEKQKYFTGEVPTDYILRSGDMIVAMTEQSDGLLGSAAFIPDSSNYLHNQRLGRIRPISPELDPGYLYYIFNSTGYRTRVRETAAGTKVKHTSPKKLLEIPVQLAPIAEQQEIAQTLKDLEELLDTLEDLIAKKNNIKQATMQELLTGKRRLPGFEGEWEVKRLGDIAVLNRNNIVPALYPDKLFTHYSLPAFDAEKAALLEAGASIGSNKFTVPASAVLVSKLNPRIPRAWAPEVVLPNAIASTEWLILTPKDGIDRSYLFALCCSPAFCEQMELAATGTTGSHQRISPSIALDIKINVTPLRDEQVAISSLLSDMDSELSILHERLQKARELKQGMMQQLLTGKIRLQ
jgi:type I restriction enzyme S subunit